MDSFYQNSLEWHSQSLAGIKTLSLKMQKSQALLGPPHPPPFKSLELRNLHFNNHHPPTSSVFDGRRWLDIVTDCWTLILTRLFTSSGTAASGESLRLHSTSISTRQFLG